jgi:hypothetical protein
MRKFSRIIAVLAILIAHPAIHQGCKVLPAIWTQKKRPTVAFFTHAVILPDMPACTHDGFFTASWEYIK